MTEFNKDTLKELLKDAILYRVVESYVIAWTDGRQFDIRVYTLPFDGGLKERFMAVPRAAWFDAENEFWGEGQTSDEALHDCLLKIKEADFDQIFHSRPFPSSEDQ
jgi:hypothetical protein